MSKYRCPWCSYTAESRKQTAKCNVQGRWELGYCPNDGKKLRRVT